jgi:PAS domain S-box-containing protein
MLSSEQVQHPFGQSEERLQGVLEFSPDAVVVVNHEGRVVRANQQADLLFGYGRGELIGQAVEMLIPEQFRAQHAQYRADYAAAPRLRPMGAGLALHARRKDGSEFPVDIMLNPVETKEGGVVIAVVRDITERKQAENLLRRQRDELAARARIIGAILQTRDLDERLDVILREAMEFLQAECGSVHLLMNNEVVLRCWSNLPDELRAHLLSFPADAIPDWMREPRVIQEALSEQGVMPDFAKRAGMQAWACVPLTISQILSGDGKPQAGWLGALTLGSRRYHDHALNEQDVQTLQGIADQLALAVDHARHLREAEQRLMRLTVLHQVDRAIVARQSVHDILHVVLRHVPQELDADAVAISLLDTTQARSMVFVMRLPNGTVVEEEAFTIAESLLHWLVERKEPVIIYDLTQDPRVQMHRGRMRNGRLASYLGVPLVAQNQTIGILHLVTTHPKVFAEEDVDFFCTLAGQAAIAIENSRMFEEATERAKALERMVANMISLAGAGPQDTHRLLGEAFREVTGVHHIACYRSDDATQTLALTEATGCPYPPEDIERRRAQLTFRLNDERSLVSLAAMTRQPLYLPDCHADPRWLPVNPNIRSAYFVPVAFGERLFSVMALLDDEACAFSSLQRSLAETFAAYAAAAMEAARLLQQTRASEEALKDTNHQLENTLRELRATQQQMVQQERLRALGTMASGIAHDFNNALVPIMGYSELLLTSPDVLGDKMRIQSYLQTIHTAALDAAGIVSRLREFYRPRDDAELRLPVSLNELVEQAVLLTQPKWKDEGLARGINIVVSTDLQSVPMVHCNPVEMREVLTNLIFNAVDAMPQGGTMTMRTRRGEGELPTQVIIEVSDTGVGMTEETRQHCFDPFFSTKGERGTGMGLAVVYGIIQRHGGTIEVESEWGKGTTFALRLPVPTQTPATPLQVVARPQQPLRVLVVDDEPTVLKVIREFLISDGHAVETAANGREALEKFHPEQFDLVVTDRAMPDMNGDQLAAAIKKMTPNKPVILLTGFGELMLATGEHLQAVDLILSKPVTLLALRRAIAQVTAE